MRRFGGEAHAGGAALLGAAKHGGEQQPHPGHRQRHKRDAGLPSFLADRLAVGR